MEPGLIRVEERGAFGVVVTSGELDLSVAPTLADAIDGLTEARAVVSLVDCTYIDSTILTVLVKSTKAREAGTLTIVLPATHRLRRIFEIANVNHILRIVGTLDEALAPDGA